MVDMDTKYYGSQRRKSGLFWKSFTAGVELTVDLERNEKPK